MFQPFLLTAVLAASFSPGFAEKQMDFFPAWQQQPAAALPPQSKEPELLMQGREAYRKGEFENALFSLQQAAEMAPTPEYRTRALYYLGRSYYSLKRFEEALASYGRLLAENPRFAPAHYEQGKVYLAQANFGQAAEQYAQLKTTSRTLQEDAKRRAEASAPQQRVEPNTVLLVTTAKEAQSLADDLAVYLADLFPPEVAARYQIPIVPLVPGASPKSLTTPTDLPAIGKDGIGRPTITAREKARYTEAARLNLVQGSVVLSVVFSAESEIKEIRVIRSLPDGLTRKAIEAALKIRFNPATKDGAPVSVRGNIEFTFNLY